MFRTHVPKAAPAQGRLAEPNSRSNRWLAALSDAAATVRLWVSRSRTRRRSRRRIADLDNHARTDIGVSRALARFESEKPFWRS